MRVAVIIPCYNAESTVERAIVSCTSQDHDIRVVVVNDRSTDRSVDVAREAGAEVVRLRYREGQSVARNKGIADTWHCTDFIQFLDADDWLEPGKIDAHANVLMSDDVLDVTWGPLRVIGSGLDEVIPQNHFGNIFPSLNIAPQTGSMFFRSRILQQQPWPVEVGTEFSGATLAFWTKILKRKPGLVYSPMGIAAYTIGNHNSLSRSLPSYKSQDPAWPYP